MVDDLDVRGAQRRGLSFNEACLYVGGISRPMMYNLINDGSIKRSFLIGNRRYFFREELDSFMESQIDGDTYVV